MKWILTEPSPGDMIRAQAGAIYHYGIYVSDAEVIQFGLSPALRGVSQQENVAVCTSDVDTFLCGKFLEVAAPEKKDKKRFSPKKTISLARSRLGEKGYHILHNNCEHFAYQCYCGEKYCSQTEDVRSLFRHLPLVDVYIAKIPDIIATEALYPPERQAEIDAAAHEGVKRQKYWVWKLLEYALHHSFGAKIQNVAFNKAASGKWTSDKCELSLSHCDNLVCVAVSRAAVGVDIERVDEQRADTLKRILNGAETRQYKAAPDKTDFLFDVWTKKESLFKKNNTGAVSLKRFIALDGTVAHRHIAVDGTVFSLAVATDTPEKIKILENVDLK